MQDLHQQISEHLRANIDWLGIDQASNISDGRPRKILDYACGHGLISQVGLLARDAPLKANALH